MIVAYRALQTSETDVVYIELFVIELLVDEDHNMRICKINLITIYYLLCLLAQTDILK